MGELAVRTVQAAVRGHQEAARALWVKIGVVYLVLLVVSMIMMSPFVYGSLGSFKRTPLEVPPTLFPRQWDWQNYPETWQALRSTSASGTGQLLFPLWVRNTFIVTVIKVISQVLLCTMAAYAFARLRFPGRNLIFYITIFSMMVPGQVTFISNFLLVNHLKLVNTLAGVIIPGLVGSFGVFLMTQFLKGIPKELEEAALIDGATRWQIFTRLIFPMSKPALGALTILSFQGSWNEFFWPYVVLQRQEVMTLPLGVNFFRFVYKEAGRWDYILVASTLSAIPIIVIYVIFQRYFIEGVSMSGLKG